MLNQFSAFLVDNLINWLNGKIAAGYRYRFHSDDPENILSLVEALNEVQISTLIYEKIELPYIQINNCKLVVPSKKVWVSLHLDLPVFTVNDTKVQLSSE